MRRVLFIFIWAFVAVTASHSAGAAKKRVGGGYVGQEPTEVHFGDPGIYKLTSSAPTICAKTLDGMTKLQDIFLVGYSTKAPKVVLDHGSVFCRQARFLGVSADVSNTYVWGVLVP